MNKLVVFSKNFLKAYLIFGISVGLGAYLYSNIIVGVIIGMRAGAIAGLIAGIAKCMSIKLIYNIKFGYFLAVVCLMVFISVFGLRLACLYSLVPIGIYYILFMLKNLKIIIRALK